MDNNKGIIMTGGSINADQIVVGDNASASKEETNSPSADEAAILAESTFTEHHRALARRLITSFNEAELEQFCFSLGIDHEDLAAKGKSSLVIKLIGHLVRRDKLDHLKTVGKRERADIPWDELLPDADSLE